MKFKKINQNRLEFVCVLLFILFLNNSVLAAQKKFEGYFSNHENTQLHLVSVFLPYNPRIILNSNNLSLFKECCRVWPFCINIDAQRDHNISEVDLIWFDFESSGMPSMSKILPKASSKVLYYTNMFIEDERYWMHLKSYLLSKGFTLLSRWFSEGSFYNAIFLKNDLFQISMNSWNYNPKGKIHSTPIIGKPKLEKYFKPFKGEKSKCHIEGIDFIYMINLDERPKKFEITRKHLSSFGIEPCRFSAVNGWELPVSVIREIGVPYSTEMTKEILMGTIYKDIEGFLCVSNEHICTQGEVYFSLGMSKGAIGIVLSHLSVLQNAYDSGYQRIWVMEDDVEVVGDPNKIPEYLRRLDQIDESWDVFFTDPDTKDFEGNYVPCCSLGARPNYAIEGLESFQNKFVSINNEIKKIGMRYGAYSMILNRSGVEKILDYFKKYRVFLPYDMDFWLVKDLHMYAPKEGIISHAAGAPTDNGLPNYLSEEE